MREGFVVAAPKGVIHRDGDVLRQLKRMPMVQYTQRHYVGRLVNAHLARQNITLTHRFEIDSYHAILALVAQGTGWTILTPLALMRARRFANQIDVMDLPFEPLTRTISLTARKGILQDMPARVAQTLRPILRKTIVEPAIVEHPFLEGSLAVF
jgi:DNA-binding transcriptional LysR family regulator